MADEMVTLRIRVAGNPRDIRDFSKELKVLATQSKLTSTKIDTMSKGVGGLNQRLKDWNKNHKILSKLLLGFIGILDKLGKLTVKLGSIGFVAVLASLSALTAAFWLGNVAVKAYRVSMAALAGLTAGAIAAVAAFAAAQRELNAAVNAYTNKSAPALGSAFNQSRSALRNLQSDAQLATAGMAALNATFAAVSKNASFDAKATKALRALDDFASAGGDRGKNLAAAGEFYGLLAKGIASGKLGLTAEIEAAGKAISPAFEKGLKEFKKKGGQKNLKTLQASLLSGELAQLGGVAGQASAVNDTLINILKGYFTRLQVVFGDIGQPLLKSLKEAADRLFTIIRDTILRIAPDVERFGKGTLLNGLIDGFEKIANFFVRLLREYLPKAEGMLKGFGSWWRKFLYGWNEVVARLQGAVNAGKEVNRIFGPVLLNVFKRLGDMFNKTSNDIKKNEARFQALAGAINNILQLVSNLYSWFTEALIQAAPALEGITSAFLVMADAIGTVIEAVQLLTTLIIPGGAGTALGGLAQIALLMFGGGMAKQFLKGGMAGGIGNAAKQTAVGKIATSGATAVSGASSAAGRGLGRFIGLGNAVTVIGTTGPAPGINPQGGVGGGSYGPAAPGSRIGRGAGRFIGNNFGRSGQGALARGATTRAGKFGFGGGMGMKIGSGLAISALGNFMDESAQPGMQLGGTAAMLGGPLVGLGVGLGAAALNAKTGAGGALLGAGSGAAIGALAGGPVGAVIGAAIGGVVGAIAGFRNKANAEKKNARAAATDLMNGYKNSLLAGMVQGTAGKTMRGISGNLNKEISFLSQFKGMSDVAKKARADEMLASGQITKDQYDKVTMKQLDSYTGELTKQSKVLNEASRGPLKTYNNRMKELTQMTGMSQKEIHDLSMEMGVNLYDETLTLADAMQKLGKTVDITAQGIIGASRDISVKAMGVFDEVINRAEASSIIDDAAEELRQLGTGAGQTDFAKFYRTLFEQLTILNPDASQFELLDMFQKQVGAGGTAYADVTGPLGGLGGTAAATGATGLVSEFVKKNMADQKGLLSDQIVTALSGSNLAVNRADIYQKLGNLSTDQLVALQNKIAGGDLSAFTDKTKNSAADQASRALAAAGISTEVVAMAKTLPEQLSIEAENLKQELVNGITEGFSNVPDWFKKNPDWFNKESFEKAFGDTSSPRGGRIGDTSTSRTLGRTMARHNYINSMVTGSRSITSSYRTYGLGSSNSDHVTGRAYDLTGQNLGMYATAVRGMGGFAEFHGVNGGRHLHVVPGQTPVGDMATPRLSGGVTAPMMPQSSDNITVNVYGAAGQDEAIIAQKVVSLLEKKQRSVRERL